MEENNNNNKNTNGSKNNAGSVVLAVILMILIIFGLKSCAEEAQPKDATYHECLKCDGTGYVRDKYGYYAYVACPRCNGAGKLYY